MPRSPRVNIEGALYYITSRAIHGQNLFNDKEDFSTYLELLSKYKDIHGFKLFSFALMNAHVHLLVETGTGTALPEIMHNITSAYTKYYNKKFNRQGHLFRGRYRATVVEKAPYLLKLTRYIHLNPVRLGLALEPGSYSYSSYLYYVAQAQALEKPIALKAEVVEALGFLAGTDYENFIKEPVSDEEKSWHCDLQRKLYLGSDVFGEMVKEKISQLRTDDAEDESEPSRFKRLVIPIASTVAVAALAGSFLLFARPGKKPEKPVTQQSVAAAEIKDEVILFELVGLDGSSWQIKFVAGTPFQTVDTLTFKDKKVSSENLSLNGFAQSSYSVTRQPNMITWETMQTSDRATASWRGDVQDGKMRGILSLKQGDKEPQDFSFVSMKYKKI